MACSASLSVCAPGRSSDPALRAYERSVKHAGKQDQPGRSASTARRSRSIILPVSGSMIHRRNQARQTWRGDREHAGSKPLTGFGTTKTCSPASRIRLSRLGYHAGCDGRHRALVLPRVRRKRLFWIGLMRASRCYGPPTASPSSSTPAHCQQCWHAKCQTVNQPVVTIGHGRMGFARAWAVSADARALGRDLTKSSRGMPNAIADKLVCGVVAP